MNFVQRVYNKYKVIAGDVVHLKQIPKFRKTVEKRERQEYNKKVLEQMQNKMSLKKTGTDDSSVSPPTKMFSRIDFEAPAKVNASTMSVLMPKDKEGNLGSSVGAYVTIRNKGGAEEIGNLSLRFDQESWATLCGYPQDWGVWDTNVDPYDSDSMTIEDWLDSEGHLPDTFTAYVSKESEKEIFKQLKTSLEKQFNDPKWKDSLPDKAKKLALKMVDKSISRL